jgi:hypothetical protein
MAWFYEIRSSDDAVLKRDGGFADPDAAKIAARAEAEKIKMSRRIGGPTVAAQRRMSQSGNLTLIVQPQIQLQEHGTDVVLKIRHCRGSECEALGEHLLWISQRGKQDLYGFRHIHRFASESVGARVNLHLRCFFRWLVEGVNASAKLRGRFGGRSALLPAVTFLMDLTTEPEKWHESRQSKCARSRFNKSTARINAR